jgi:hypothetical protein
MMTIKFGAAGAGATSRYGSGSVFLCSRSEHTKIWSFGDWSFGEWSPSENGLLRRLVVRRLDIWRLVVRRMVVRRMDGVPYFLIFTFFT